MIGVKIFIGGDCVFYCLFVDIIVMLDCYCFIGMEISIVIEGWYLIFFYELMYWIGVLYCMDCIFGKCFGDDVYVMEEMVVELGVVFFCGDFGIIVELCFDYVVYIDNWFCILKFDCKVIFIVVSVVNKVVEYLVGLLNIEYKEVV